MSGLRNVVREQKHMSCTGFSDALSKVRVEIGETLHNECVVEHYPRKVWTPSGWKPEVFSYQFFVRTEDGIKNCAYYIPDMKSVTVLDCNREWGLPIQATRDLTDYLKALGF